MKSGPIKKATPKSYVGRNKKATTEAAQGTEKKGANQEPLVLTPEQRVDAAPTEGAKTQAPAEPVTTPPVQEEVVDGTTLGVKFDLSPDVEEKALSGDLVMGLIPKGEKEALKAKGAFFPENADAVLGDGVGPEGSVEITAVYDSKNPDTKNHLVTHEVDKKNLEVNPETGAEQLKAGFSPTILAQGEGVLPAGHKSVLQGANVVAEGYTGKLKLTGSAADAEGHRTLLNNGFKTLGTFTGTSLAGLPSLPLVGAAAPYLAIAAVGFNANANFEAKRDAKAQLKYLEQQEKLSTNDMVEMVDSDVKPSGEDGIHHEWINGQNNTYKVSAKGERARLKSKVMEANLQLLSTVALAGSGATYFMGAAGMAAAAATTPFLAGGAVVLGNGTAVFKSITALKDLSKEKAELEAAQAAGETHVDRVVELPHTVGVNHKVLKDGRVTSKPVVRLQSLDNMVKTPIKERLKQIGKDQRKHRLIATALTGTAASTGSLVTGISGAVGLGFGATSLVALVPAGGLLAAQSIGQLRELGKERKDLLAAKERGETMVSQDFMQADYSYQTERVPISSLLSENKKSRNLHKLILTSVGSAGAALGMTIGMGMGAVAAAPLALVPITVGAMLFPDKVKVFADKVKGLVSGMVGEQGSTKRAARSANEETLEAFQTRWGDKLSGLKEEHPKLFADRALKLNPLRNRRVDEEGGYFLEMGLIMADYASASSPAERQEYLKLLGTGLRNSPPEAQEHMKAFEDEILEFTMNVEAQWTARDIALSMKNGVGKKVLSDKRVAKRIEELGYSKENIPEMYQESLQVMDFERQYSSLAMAKRAEEVEIQQRIQSGDPDAKNLSPNYIFDPAMKGVEDASVEFIDSVNGDSQYDSARWEHRNKVFKAAHHLASKEQELGVKLMTRYVDAARQAENKDNLELLMKEVTYIQKSPVSEEDMLLVASSTRVLESPVQLAQERPDEHVARLRGAVEEMHQADPKLTSKMLEADAKSSNPEHFKGMTAQEALAERTKLNAVFHAGKRGLKKLVPEAFKTWEQSDQKIRELAAAKPQETPAPIEISGPESRMTNAFLGLAKVEPKLTAELGDAFASLNSASAYQGMDANQAMQTKVAANLQLQKVRKKLANKQPEMMALWDNARQEVERAHFDREMNHEFKDTVLSMTSVTEAAERLGITGDETEELYTALMKSQILHDPRDLQARVADESGEDADEGKLEMLTVIDRALMRAAAAATNGGADAQQPSDISGDPKQDPNVIAWLQQSPEVQGALNSDGLKQLAQNMQLPLPQVLDAYLTLVQADLNPVIGAEFIGLLQGGDMNTVNTYKVGQEVLKYVQEFVKPDPAVVEQLVEQNMQGPIVQSVLGDERIHQTAESLSVDAPKVMRLYLQARLGGDRSGLADLEIRAQKGDSAAAAEMRFLETMIPAVVEAEHQAQAGTLEFSAEEPPKAA